MEKGRLTIVLTQGKGGAFGFDVNFSGDWSGFAYNRATRAMAKAYKEYKIEQRREGDKKWKTNVKTPLEEELNQTQQSPKEAKQIIKPQKTTIVLSKKTSS